MELKEKFTQELKNSGYSQPKQAVKICRDVLEAYVIALKACEPFAKHSIALFDSACSDFPEYDDM